MPILSMPQALSRFFLEDRRPLVVAGTHGKTTTTAMAAWVYTACGRDPGYLIGGAPLDLPASFHDGTGERFIIEGDEYNAAYFDRGAKFLHYRPETLILTSAEYDHADLYPTPEALFEAFARLIALLPPTGCWSPAATLRRSASWPRSAPCPVRLLWAGGGQRPLPAGAHRGVCRRGAGSGFQMPEARRDRGPAPPDRRAQCRQRPGACGRRRAATASRQPTWPPPSPASTASSGGWRCWARSSGDHRGRRFRPPSHGGREDLGSAAPALSRAAARGALRAAQPDRRAGLLLRALPRAPSPAPTACSSRPPSTPAASPPRRGSTSARSPRPCAPTASRPISAPSTDEVLRRALDEARAGDVLVTMSSGSFDGMPHRLAAAISSSASPPRTAPAGGPAGSSSSSAG